MISPGYQDVPLSLSVCRYRAGHIENSMCADGALFFTDHCTIVPLFLVPYNTLKLLSFFPLSSPLLPFLFEKKGRKAENFLTRSPPLALAKLSHLSGQMESDTALLYHIQFCINTRQSWMFVQGDREKYSISFMPHFLKNDFL